MTLFDNAGHMTNQALAALAEGSLCAAQREQLALHLTVCDDCLLRLTAMQQDEMPLLTPTRSLVPAAMAQQKRRRAIEFIRRCGIVAAAACFLIAGWRLELFDKLGQKPGGNPQLLQQWSSELAQGVTALNDRFAETLRGTLEHTPAVQPAETQQRSD